MVEYQWLGLTDYDDALVLQNELHAHASNRNQGYVIGLEHPAVITMGARALVAEEVSTTISDIPVVPVRRGGLATLHSQGQLVIYPVIPLRHLGLGTRDYVCLLQKTTTNLLKELGVNAHCDDENVGVFVGDQKIGFCGIQVRNGVSLHGISINNSNDLSLFNYIQSCGVKNAPLTRLQDLGISIENSELFRRWSESFATSMKSVMGYSSVG